MGRKRTPPETTVEKLAKGQTKKAAATKTPAKPKAKLSAKDRAVRNSELVAMKLARPELPWTAIASEFNLTVRQAYNIYKVWGDIGQRELASADQERFLHEQIEGLRLLRGELWKTYMNAGENYSAKIGALKAIGELRIEEIKLLQATGRMPKNLGSLEILLDIRHTKDVFIAWADKWVLEKLDEDVRIEATVELADVLAAALPKEPLELELELEALEED